MCSVFRMNGKVATRAAVRQQLLQRHVFGEFSFVRQAQVAELVQRSSPAALARVITGALQRWTRVCSTIMKFLLPLQHVISH